MEAGTLIAVFVAIGAGIFAAVLSTKKAGTNHPGDQGC